MPASSGPPLSDLYGMVEPARSHMTPVVKALEVLGTRKLSRDDKAPAHVPNTCRKTTPVSWFVWFPGFLL